MLSCVDSTIQKLPIIYHYYCVERRADSSAESGSRNPSETVPWRHDWQRHRPTPVLPLRGVQVRGAGLPIPGWGAQRTVASVHQPGQYLSYINTSTVYNSPLVCEGSGDSVSYINPGTLYNSPLVCVGPGDSVSYISTGTLYNSPLVCVGPGDSVSYISTGTLYNSPLVCVGPGDSVSYISTGTLYNSPLVCVGPGESESLISTVYNSPLVCDGPGDSPCIGGGGGGGGQMYRYVCFREGQTESEL